MDSGTRTAPRSFTRLHRFSPIRIVSERSPRANPNPLLAKFGLLSNHSTCAARGGSWPTLIRFSLIANLSRESSLRPNEPLAGHARPGFQLAMPDSVHGLAERVWFADSGAASIQQSVHTADARCCNDDQLWLLGLVCTRLQYWRGFTHEAFI